MDWPTTAIIITYDDSDGWYDHQMPPIVNSSYTSIDALNGSGICNAGLQQDRPAAGTLNGSFGQKAQGRCGYGTRIPLLLISRFAKPNHVDHTLIDQTSVIRFIEDNWLAGQRVQSGASFDTIAGSLTSMFNFEDKAPRQLYLDPKTGAVVFSSASKD